MQMNVNYYDREERAIVPLSDSIANNISLFGAKTANLARSIQMGFSVPEGIAISRLCTEQEIEPFAQEIINTLGGIVAVRSSAVKEDSSTQAFAGMFETRLGVHSTSEFLEAFTFVKESGNSKHLQKYQGGSVQEGDIAVLIQSMINAMCAGVAFSREPNTGEKIVIIESNYGIGKSVVDGIVTPDSIEYIDETTQNIFIGRKSKQIIMSDNGIDEKEVKQEDSNRCSLSNEQIQEIAQLARRVENDLGFPADIEWAFDESNTLWLLQARPITTINL